MLAANCAPALFKRGVIAIDLREVSWICDSTVIFKLSLCECPSIRVTQRATEPLRSRVRRGTVGEKPRTLRSRGFISSTVCVGCAAAPCGPSRCPSRQRGPISRGSRIFEDTRIPAVVAIHDPLHFASEPIRVIYRNELQLLSPSGINYNCCYLSE